MLLGLVAFVARFCAGLELASRLALQYFTLRCTERLCSWLHKFAAGLGVLACGITLCHVAWPGAGMGTACRCSCRLASRPPPRCLAFVLVACWPLALAGGVGSCPGGFRCLAGTRPAVLADHTLALSRHNGEGGWPGLDVGALSAHKCTVAHRRQMRLRL